MTRALYLVAASIVAEMGKTQSKKSDKTKSKSRGAVQQEAEVSWIP